MVHSMDTVHPMTSSLAEIFSNTADGVLGVDQDHIIILWNRAAERLVGFTAAEVMGRPCAEVWAVKSRTGCRLCGENCSPITSARKEEPVEGREIMTHTKAGRPLWLHVSTIVVPGGAPSLFTMVHIFHDVTRQVETEVLLGKVQSLLGSEGVLLDSSGMNPPEGASPLKVLTPREQEVLRFIARGESAKGIAKALQISTTTARNHTQKILSKLGLHAKVEAVALAYRYKHF
ncbi:Transcriptional regulatory protein DegU [Candidatus Methylomirabilis lanthanidiphila]|uniref:Transcriptional regulatory protein DegU n=1 Tax=Candidatus Methylomirabilis lanthanidiphila TaxID=2211376 RepID=A0A564ZKN4_9BACT|nr:Transcriptional regulatory protein DegU [Candidatus Methylomirabilis lanthanidiphila]